MICKVNLSFAGLQFLGRGLSLIGPLSFKKGININDISFAIERCMSQLRIFIGNEKYQALMLTNTHIIQAFNWMMNWSHFNWDIKLLGVKVGNNLKLDAHLPDIFRKVGRQVNILPLQLTIFFFYCSQVWLHCWARNTNKLENVNDIMPALRFIY